MSEPLVSVVVPVYDRAETVQRCIDSALSQDMASLEVIAVDDGSRDDTAERIAAFDDPRVRLLRHTDNRGAAAARNTGISAARGRWIAFLDSDDTWDSDKLSRQLAELERVSNAVACCTGYRLVRARDGRIVERRLDVETDWRRHLLEACDLGAGSTLLVRRDVLRAMGGFPEDMPRLEEWDVLFALAERGLTVCPEPAATVHETGYPPPESVARSAERLLERRGDWVAQRFGEAGRRRFAATLRIERAYACFRAGRLGAMSVQAAAAAGVSPLRVLQAGRRLAGKLAIRDI